MKTTMLRFLRFARGPMGIATIFALFALLGALGLRCSCGGEADDAPPAERGFSTIRDTQGGAAQTSFAGVVDPTAVGGPAGPAVLTACLSGCSGALAEQNRAALKATFDYASANRMWVHIPPNEYPVARASGQVYGVDVTGSNLSILARGVVLRFTGDQTSTAGAMIRVRASNVKIEGLTVSLRDVTNPTADTVGILVGDGGTTTVDNIQLVDDQFVEGATGSGDFLRMDGGTAALTVTRATVTRCRFEGGKRAGVDVRPGVERVNANFNFFRGNANRDIWFENTGDGPLGRFTIEGNFIETDKSNPAVTLSGNGGANVLEQSQFSSNRIIPQTGASGGGGVVEGSALARTSIKYNTIITDRATSAPSLSLTGSVTDVEVVANYVERRDTASSAAVIQVADDATTAPTGVRILWNRVKQYSGIAPGIDASSCVRCNVSENKITYHGTTADSGATGFQGILCQSVVAPCSGNYSRNVVRRDDQKIRASLDLGTLTTHVNTIVEYYREGTEGNGATLTFVGDSGSTPGSKTAVGIAITIHFRPGFTTVANVETLLNEGAITVKTPGTGSNVLASPADAFSATHLAGGAQAGRMLAGLEITKASSTVGALVARDNFVDGARTLYYSDATGSADYPDGYPLISGNGSINTTNTFEGGILTWVTETTPLAEVVASGATSVTKEITFLTTNGTVTYTQADGIRDGQRHCFKVKTVTGTPAGTWTPTHFADGTTHTITWSSATDVSWCVVWEAAVPTWRLTSKSAGATLN